MKPSDPSQLSRNSSISPTEGIKFQDGQELTTNGKSSARRPPVEVVRGESSGKVLSCSPSPARVAEVDLPEMPTMVAFDEDEEEVEQGRPAHTWKPLVGMTPAEMNNYAPGCRSCVAGRKRDHQHPRRSGVEEMQQELDAANAHISADYFFPKDAPGHKGVTAIAVRDRETDLLAGHVVEQKGAGQQGSVSQLLKDLRKMGHHDKIVIRTDQEASIVDFFKRVAKDRGASKTIIVNRPSQ